MFIYHIICRKSKDTLYPDIRFFEKINVGIESFGCEASEELEVAWNQLRTKLLGFDVGLCQLDNPFKSSTFCQAMRVTDESEIKRKPITRVSLFRPTIHGS